MKENTLILLLLAVGVGGYLWWNTTQAKRQGAAGTESAEPGPGPSLGFSIGGRLGLPSNSSPLPPVRDPALGFGTSTGLDRSYYDFLAQLGGTR